MRFPLYTLPMSKSRLTTLLIALVIIGFQFAYQEFENQNKPVTTPTPVLLPSNSPNLQTLGSATNSGEFVGVVKVVDGDTITVQINGVKQTVRLIGIDTPETVDPRKPVQCFGRDASAKTKELVMGKNVRLEADPTQSNLDKYKRLLRYVYLEDGSLVNKVLIEQGYAHEYTYDIPYQFQSEFRIADQQARESQLGLWNPQNCQ